MSRYLAILLVLAAVPLAADSPITSTSFYKVYLDHGIVKRARKSGVLTKEMSRFLASPRSPVGVKAALINALSWKFDGKNNANLFRAYLASRHGTSMQRLPLQKLTSHELMSLGYLMAMDDYHNPERAVPVVELAVEKNPYSMTVAIINALVQGQAAMESDWCRIWYVAQQVREDSRLRPDLRPKAVESIFDYLVLYQQYCKD